MKDYKRLTVKSVGCFKYCLKNHKSKDGEFKYYDTFFDYSMAVKRLGELEDKIEFGELVEVPKGAAVLTHEERAEEMRLCNEERKQLERRAEIAERALLDMCRETAASRDFANKWQKYYKEQAEREIEEGKKDE